MGIRTCDMILRNRNSCTDTTTTQHCNPRKRTLSYITRIQAYQECIQYASQRVRWASHARHRPKHATHQLKHASQTFMEELRYQGPRKNLNQISERSSFRENMRLVE